MKSDIWVDVRECFLYQSTCLDYFHFSVFTMSVLAFNIIQFHVFLYLVYYFKEVLVAWKWGYLFCYLPPTIALFPSCAFDPTVDLVGNNLLLSIERTLKFCYVVGSAVGMHVPESLMCILQLLFLFFWAECRLKYNQWKIIDRCWVHWNSYSTD